MPGLFDKYQAVITEETAVQGFATSSRPQDLQPTAQIQAPGRGNTYVSKLNLAHFPQSTDDFSTNLVRNVELGQGHVAGAEEGIFGDRHDARGRNVLAAKGSIRDTPCTQCDDSL